MKIFSALFVAFLVAIACAARGPVVTAQAPQPAPAGNLAQVMKSIPYPNSNVIFDTQDWDPATNEAGEFAMSAGPRRPYDGAYGGWEAVENSALAIAEFTNVLMLPGRECSNGQPAPIDAADWPGFVQNLRAAAMVTYEAAQSRDADAMLNAADVLVTACGNCHDQYRDVAGGPANRCMVQ
jgi:cytochrome c556